MPPKSLLSIIIIIIIIVVVVVVIVVVVVVVAPDHLAQYCQMLLLVLSCENFPLLTQRTNTVTFGS